MVLFQDPHFLLESFAILAQTNWNLTCQFWCANYPEEVWEVCKTLICVCFCSEICNWHTLGQLSHVCAPRIRIKNINHHKANCSYLPNCSQLWIWSAVWFRLPTPTQYPDLYHQAALQDQAQATGMPQRLGWKTMKVKRSWPNWRSLLGLPTTIGGAPVCQLSW